MTKKTTKRSLIASVCALAMCFSAFVGTTYAWFTDEVASEGNIIQTGTLDVGMYWAEGTETVEGVTWTDASQTAIFNYDKWQPGHVDAKHVQIRNEGSIAFQYVVSINANGEISKLADVIDVYFIDPAAQVDTEADLSVYESLKVGTLAEVMNGQVTSAKGVLFEGETAEVTIVLQMQESAGNEYQGLSIGTDFSVVVVATQINEEALTYVKYDTALTPDENGQVLQAALNAADKGDIVLASAGVWGAKATRGFEIKTDNVTFLGEDGAKLQYVETNTNSIVYVTGDNVTIKNFDINTNYNEYNQCILAIGAENLTVEDCTIYGENTGNTPTMGIYIFENLDGADDEANDEVTTYTIQNNNFFGAAIGTYKGGTTKVTTDPGVITAQVSETMLIQDNTFVDASVFIEAWRSWRTENTRDHEYVPTIVNNNFVSPNLCFDNTPHSIYLRVYRQGDPEKVLPAGYIESFIANNTVATPANNTVKEYDGAKYVLKNTYETFFRTNATYGNIAYCYGQSYATYATTAEEAQAALDNATEGAIVQLAPGVNYGTLQFGTNVTVSTADNKTVIANSPNTEAVDYYTAKYPTGEFVRKVENLTIIGAEGATVDSIKFVGGTFKVDLPNGRQSGSMYRFVEVTNLVIDGVEFTDKSTVGGSFVSPIFVDLQSACVNGITVKNCTLNGNNSKMNFVYAYGNVASGCTFGGVLKNVVIENNTVSGIARLCELREAENVTIQNNNVSNLTKEFALFSNNAGKAYSGEIIVSGNVAENIAKNYAEADMDCLFFRVGVGGDANITVAGNIITNSGTVNADTFVNVTSHTGTLTVVDNTLA